MLQIFSLKANRARKISRCLPKQQFSWLGGWTRVRCSWRGVSTIHDLHCTWSNKASNNLVCLSGPRLNQKSAKNELRRHVSQRDFDLMPSFHSESMRHDLNSRDWKLRLARAVNRRHVLTRNVANSVGPTFTGIREYEKAKRNQQHWSPAEELLTAAGKAYVRSLTTSMI